LLEVVLELELEVGIGGFILGWIQIRKGRETCSFDTLKMQLGLILVLIDYLRFLWITAHVTYIINTGDGMA